MEVKIVVARSDAFFAPNVPDKRSFELLLDTTHIYNKYSGHLKGSLVYSTLLWFKYLSDLAGHVHHLVKQVGTFAEHFRGRAIFLEVCLAYIKIFSCNHVSCLFFILNNTF